MCALAFSTVILLLCEITNFSSPFCKCVCGCMCVYASVCGSACVCASLSVLLLLFSKHNLKLFWLKMQRHALALALALSDIARRPWGT